MELLAGASTAYQTGQILGMAALAALLVALIRRWMNARTESRARTTDAIAAVVVAALLIGGIVRLVAGADRDDPWKTDQGVQLKAGFMAGCHDSANGLVDCGCAFKHITSVPPYDTPSGFASLSGPVDAAKASGDPRDLPAVLMSALSSCRVSAS